VSGFTNPPIGQALSGDVFKGRITAFKVASRDVV
jgi:hypothetical protein